MSNDTENCPYCSTVNSYKSTHCVICREELPWAGWVKAARGPSEALGAETKHYFRPGEGQMEVSGGISSGTRYKLLAIVLPLLAVMAIAFFAMKHFSAGNGNVVEQFKKANPALQGDAELRKDSR